MKILGKDIYAYVSFPNRSLYLPKPPLKAASAKPLLTLFIWGCKCVLSMYLFLTPELEIDVLTIIKHVDSAPKVVEHPNLGCHRRNLRASDENRPFLPA